MYICLCNGVTDKQIRRAVQQGAHSFDAIQGQLEVGLCCGQCRDSTEQLIEETLTGHHSDNVVDMWRPRNKTSKQKPCLTACGN